MWYVICDDMWYVMICGMFGPVWICMCIQMFCSYYVLHAGCLQTRALPVHPPTTIDSWHCALHFPGIIAVTWDPQRLRPTSSCLWGKERLLMKIGIWPLSALFGYSQVSMSLSITLLTAVDPCNDIFQSTYSIWPYHPRFCQGVCIFARFKGAKQYFGRKLAL